MTNLFPIKGAIIRISKKISSNPNKLNTTRINIASLYSLICLEIDINTSVSSSTHILEFLNKPKLAPMLCVFFSLVLLIPLIFVHFGLLFPLFWVHIFNFIFHYLTLLLLLTLSFKIFFKFFLLFLISFKLFWFKFFCLFTNFYIFFSKKIMESPRRKK